MMRSCKHCTIRYDDKRSTSSLRLTYCCHAHEINDMGFSMEAFLTNVLKHGPAAPRVLAEAAGCAANA